ncbi:hypothetical protein CPC16_011372 [Podila verticillata]|nr:hypothetical protein CPC16_011372 [Podila verticillata]KAI9242290.1 MAG: hypothetical protein BYD32DRAFT_457115 [Podila humilis]
MNVKHPGIIQDDTHVGFGDTGATYDTFIGVPLTPLNILLFKSIGVATVLQAAAFYLTWHLKPSLSQNRRGMAWVLSLYCAITLLSLFVFEIGHIRTPIFSHLGLDSETLGLAPEATVFSYFAPTFHAWVQKSAYHYPGSLAWKNTFWQGIGHIMALPIFSLAPNKPTSLYSPDAHRYLGGGGRLLISLENFPRESATSSISVGYFTAYCIVDLILGRIHYPKYVDLLSGYFHHFMYLGLVQRLALQEKISLFNVCGSPLELSTIFLASGMIWPERRSDVWFPVSFFLCRILFVIAILHEVQFNMAIPTGGTSVYALALAIHVYWFWKYFQGVKRRKMRKEKEEGKEGGHKETGKDKTTSSTAVRKTIQLRATSTSAKAKK